MKNYIIRPIGISSTTDGGRSLTIYEKYRSGLLNTDKFSHLLILWTDPRGDEISTARDDINPEIDGRDRVFPGSIRLTTVQIGSINQKDGIISYTASHMPLNSLVLDIKAHIPVSDRVRNAVVPRKYSGHSEQIPETEQVHFPDGETDDDIAHKDEIILNPIGVTEKSKGKNYLIVNREYMNELERLREFSHIRILWWFHRLDNERSRRTLKVNPPYENAPKCGVFATRSPVRPNPLALTTVRVLNMDADNGRIEIGDFDAFDKTPIIDILPYIPHLDRVESYKVPDWFKHWPEFMIEGDELVNTDPSILLSSDIDRLEAMNFSGKKESGTRSRRTDEVEVPVVRTDKNCIEIIGARQNNLKNIEVKIPYNKMTVITGVSGSGKSSLAFDTLYAEGQYRYIKSLSTTARVLADQMEEPDVDRIHGLLPTIAIEQRTIVRNPRSTVGSLTDIFSLLRVLFTRLGTRYCPGCARAVKPQPAPQLSSTLVELPRGTVFDISPLKEGSPGLPSTRITIPEGKRGFSRKLCQIVQAAYDEGSGYIGLTMNDGEFLFCERNACPYCRRFFFEMSPSMLSNLNPEGMCPHCEGLGKRIEVDPRRVVDKPHLSLLDGASQWFGVLREVKPTGNWMRAELFALADIDGVDLELPWNDLPEDFRRNVLYGTGQRVLKWSYDMKTRGRTIGFERPAQGAIPNIQRLLKQTSSPGSRKRLLVYTTEIDCDECKGERLSPEGRFVRFHDKRYPEVTHLSIGELVEWLDTAIDNMDEEAYEIGRGIIKELRERGKGLCSVGLHYLTLDRSLPTLSGGEAQRLRLASQLGSQLNGLIYILDEPSIGLHPRDNRELINSLLQLRDRGNTVVVVEHDGEAMMKADQLMDIGPGAGAYGGEIVSCGTPGRVMEDPASVTGKYLRGERSIYKPVERRRTADKWINLRGARKNNLKEITLDIPLEVFCCVTGVSGSGKSSLITQTLLPALLSTLGNARMDPTIMDAIDGEQNIDKVIMVDQSPIGRTPRSNPATYSGVLDEMRKVYANVKEAKDRKMKVSHFSFNSKEGRCEACEGHGKKRIQLNFMPDVWVTCRQCGGKRYKDESLAIKYRGKSISDILDMEVRDALKPFHDNQKITKVLDTLCEVGLGYIKLGQSAVSLSGGEAQRIKLARELSNENTGKTLYILDEPTTGLHFSDIDKLLLILHRLVDAGNSVIVIEHNIDVINSADWVMDLGPEGGNEGGYLIASGTPEKVMKVEKSHTGMFLRELRGKSSSND